MKGKRKKKIETSKILLIVSDVITGICTVAAIVAVFVIKDTTPLVYLIPAAYGLSATSHGFYYWKAKAENLQKLGRLDAVSMEDPQDVPDENNFTV